MKNKKIQKNRILLIMFVLVFCFVLLAPSFVLAKESKESKVVTETLGSIAFDTVLGGVGVAVATVLSLIAYILTAAIGLLITLLSYILVQIAQFSNIINVPTVIRGWIIVRDLCNMFFILILLVIAFGTILRQENYSAKKLLPKVLIMAVLINFSRMFFGLIVDFSQIIMLTFVGSFKAGSGWFISMFQVNIWHTMIKDSDTAKKLNINSWTTVLAIISGVLAAIVTLIVMTVIVAVLAVRIVMLWIYTILSPFVFLGWAFPPLQKYTNKIWEDFIKQAMIGPILAFFIWLALTTLSTEVSLGGVDMTNFCTGLSGFFCSDALTQFIIVIGFLMGGLMVAQQAGGAAGSIAGKGMGAVKSLGSFVGKQPRDLGFWAGRKLDTAQMAVQKKIAGLVGVDKYKAKSLNYRMIGQAWKSQREKSSKEYEAGKTGSWEETFGTLLHASVGPKATLGLSKKIPIGRAQRLAMRREQDLKGQVDYYDAIIDKTEAIKDLTEEQIASQKQAIQARISQAQKGSEAEKTAKKELEIFEKAETLNEGDEQKLKEFKQKRDNIETMRKQMKKAASRWGGPPPKTNQERIDKNRIIGDAYSEISKENLDEDELVNAYLTETDKIKKQAYFQHLVDINALNTLFAALNKSTDHESVLSFLKDEFGDDAADVALDMGRRAGNAGNYKFVGFAEYDAASGKNKLTDKATQISKAINKSNEKYDQKAVREMHWDVLVNHAGSGEPEELSDLGVEQLLAIGKSKGKMSELGKGNFQNRFGKKVLSLKSDIKARIQQMERDGDTKNAEILRKVLEGFQKQYGEERNQESNQNNQGADSADKNNQNSRIEVVGGGGQGARPGSKKAF